MNWYPGHMAKSTNKLKKIISKSHIVLEVLDIRCFKTSHNTELLTMIDKNKVIIKVFVKCDLITKDDLNNVKKLYHDGLYISNKNKDSKNYILKYIKQLKVYQDKLFINIFVLGIPNVGKSTLINNLIGKRKIKIQNKPGQTRLITPFQISNKIYLFDTPGILYKKIQTHEMGYILGLTNLINEKVLDLNKTIDFACSYLFKNYKIYFKKWYPALYKYYLLDKNNYKKLYLKNKNSELNDQSGLLFIFYKFQKSKQSVVWDF